MGARQSRSFKYPFWNVRSCPSFSLPMYVFENTCTQVKYFSVAIKKSTCVMHRFNLFEYYHQSNLLGVFNIFIRDCISIFENIGNTHDTLLICNPCKRFFRLFWKIHLEIYCSWSKQNNLDESACLHQRFKMYFAWNPRLQVIKSTS